MAEFTTTRLRVREYREADFEAHHRLFSDAKTMYHLDDIMTHSKAESRENLLHAMAAAGKTPRTELFLAMELAETGAYIGSLGYTVIASPPPGKIAHMGYFMLPEYHGHGYMTEAVRGLMQYAFTQGGLYRLNTGCFAENKASERVMQKCGMVKEGHFVKAAWHDGQMKDRLAYRLLKEEWQALQAATGR